MKNGFTVAEILVVMSVMAISGVIITQIFLNSVRGGNKAQITDAIKQNGQLALDLMDKTIKNSDSVICVTTDTIAVQKDSLYTRYRFTNPTGSANGKITQDNPTYADPKSVTSAICGEPQVSPVNISDTNTRTGASIQDGVFSWSKKAGFADIVSIQFNVGPGVGTLPAVKNGIDLVPFSTSVVLRNYKI